MKAGATDTTTESIEALAQSSRRLQWSLLKGSLGGFGVSSVVSIAKARGALGADLLPLEMLGALGSGAAVALVHLNSRTSPNDEVDFALRFDPSERVPSVICSFLLAAIGIGVFSVLRNGALLEKPILSATAFFVTSATAILSDTERVRAIQRILFTDHSGFCSGRLRVLAQRDRTLNRLTAETLDIGRAMEHALIEQRAASVEAKRARRREVVQSIVNTALKWSRKLRVRLGGEAWLTSAEEIQDMKVRFFMKHHLGGDLESAWALVRRTVPIVELEGLGLHAAYFDGYLYVLGPERIDADFMHEFLARPALKQSDIVLVAMANCRVTLEADKILQAAHIEILRLPSEEILP